MRKRQYNILFHLILAAMAACILSGCADMPPLIMTHDDAEKQPAYTQSGAGSSGAARRAPLDVPPELRGEVAVPMPENIASQPQAGGASVQKPSVAGQAVSLDARAYDQPADVVFSAVVDAMTALNLPVQSVDSPSGTVTTEWVRHDANTKNVFASGLSNMFGGENVLASRHRFVVRVLRLKTEDGDKTQLQVRTLGQVYINRHWVNRQVKRNVAEELFVATGEQLARHEPVPAPGAAVIGEESLAQ